MAVKIRLSRVGTKNAPMYRIVAIDSRDKREGCALEILGTYNPRRKVFDQFNEERLKTWLANGALLTDAAKKLHKVYCKHNKQQSVKA